ncbi:MAG: hypothetical protein CMN30_07610 [Sandaracinus sp.]|nr:hypothetical protein [Sandaracinus sp.]
MTALEGEDEGTPGEDVPRETGPRPASGNSLAPPPIPIGRVIGGRYRVEGSIGGGGMGHVFEVEHQALGRRFALKVLRVNGWNDELVRRFEREAKALAKVGSVRVAQVTDFGVEEGIGPWFVMELVSGETLQDRLDRTGAVPVAEGLKLAVALCEAVEDVHAQGIVHRDLKPANIGLPPGPIPLKLLDFGLAAGIDDAMLTRITQSHQVMGSLPYIAPEQFAGSRPGKPQDLWAMGIVIYEMFTGRLPFEAPSTAALMHKILTAPPPAFDAFPEGLRVVLGALLVKNPKERLASAAEAAAMLRRVDASELPDSLELALPEVPTLRDMDPMTPPHAATELARPVSARPPAEESAHVNSAGVSVASASIPLAESGPVARPQPVDTGAVATPRTAPWVPVAIGALILALLGLVAFLALRQPAADPAPTEPAADTTPEPPPPVVEPSTMEEPAIAEEPVEPPPEAEEPAAAETTDPEETPPASRTRRRTSRMTASPMTTPTEPAPDTTMGSSSWMGEILGGGWGGEIIEGAR